MGRYYNGDIEGKFWFAVQPSNDADFFGVEGQTPQELSYYFDEDSLKDVSEGIKACNKKLGKFKTKLDNFFKDCEGYNNAMVSKALKVTEVKARELLEWYARLELGLKIEKCIKDQGYCSFIAEC